MFIKSLCQNCGGTIDFEDAQEGQKIECPHCGVDTLLVNPASPQLPLPQSKPLRLTIGDIGITEDLIITPNGSAPLAGSQWIFTDTSRTETKIPTVAIVLAIIFAFFCLLGLLFLLMKEKTITGYVEVTVRSGNLYHKTQIPVSTRNKIEEVRDLVSQAQAMTAEA